MKKRAFLSPKKRQNATISRWCCRVMTRRTTHPNKQPRSTSICLPHATTTTPQPSQHPPPHPIQPFHPFSFQIPVSHQKNNNTTNQNPTKTPHHQLLPANTPTPPPTATNTILPVILTNPSHNATISSCWRCGCASTATHPKKLIVAL